MVRFAVFVALAALAVSVLYFWRSGSAPVVVADNGSILSVNGGTAEYVTAGRFPGLAAMDEEFSRLVSETMPAVVSITASQSAILRGRMQHMTRHYTPWGRFQAPMGLGSGVIVSPHGHVITNLHVIESADQIDVQLGDGRSFQAEILGADPRTDLAVLRIAADGLQWLPFADSDQVRAGQMVFAVGNPYGLQETVTQGIISAVGRRSTSEVVNEFFQTDTAINRGNSGGPLLNLRGEVVGINNSITTESGGWQGIGFAIPSNTARRVFEDIRDHGRVVRTWFGVEMLPRALNARELDSLGLPDGGGALVLVAVDNSPAEKIGVRAGDVITEFNGRRVRDFIDLRNRVAETEAGQSVDVRLYRDGEEQVLNVRMEASPHG